MYIVYCIWISELDENGWELISLGSVRYKAPYRANNTLSCQQVPTYQKFMLHIWHWHHWQWCKCITLQPGVKIT